MIALETALPLTLELVKRKKITPSRLVELLSLAPAKILGLEAEAGSLKAGCHADFVVFDPKANFTFTEQHVHSASRNSPFLGRKMQGIVQYTFVGSMFMQMKTYW